MIIKLIMEATSVPLSGGLYLVCAVRAIKERKEVAQGKPNTDC